MDHLDDVSLAELQNILARTDDKKPVLRLVVAIAYKQGITQTQLASWFAVERKTIYNWLSRFDSDNLEANIHDQTRPGRPRKLTTEEFKIVEAAVSRSSTTEGFEMKEWNPTLLQEFLEDRFDISYSHTSCRRLLEVCRDSE